MAALNFLYQYSYSPIQTNYCSPQSSLFTHKARLKISHPTCSYPAQISHPPNSSQRKSANYKPTIWDYNFLQSLNISNADGICKDKAKKLEEKVRCVINNGDAESTTVLEMIDDIQRLGLSDLFQEDIKRILDKINSSMELQAHKSLHHSALIFRLLRQHGYQVSQDVLKEFMDHNGELLSSVQVDTKGILSLYEASHVAFEGEHVLEKSMAQTKKILLNKIVRTVDDDMTTMMIRRSLEVPLHRRMVMLEARWYIDAYSMRNDADSNLLQLAKIHFNMAQSVLQTDLKDMSWWWKNLGLSDKLTFSRDRSMECFFWTVGMLFEPQFSSCRKGLTKVTSFITIIDDVYDVYGTLDELELFTDAIERWDVNAVKNLPDYMKLCFMAFFNTINEMAYETLKEQGDDVISCLTKAWVDLFKAFLEEAKWSKRKRMPTMEEYIENGWRSVSGTVILVHTFFLLAQNNSKEALDDLLSYPHLLRWSSIIFRLSNDLGTSSGEITRGETINSISCYMNDTGASENEARQHISKMIDEAWKKINEHQFDESPFGKTFIKTVINMARIAQHTYQNGDSHGSPDSNSKNTVLSLIIEPISL